MTDTPGKRQIAVRGTLIAIAAAAVIGSVVFAAVILITGRIDDAARVAAYVALGYLALNLVVLGVGLLVRPPASWAVGAALATPVIVAAIGFGYSIYSAYSL